MSRLRITGGTYDYDLVVAGAGVAGIAAALEAARAGLRVALLDKTIIPGGLATSGLINVYLPLCDGRGRQVTFGIAEELLRLSLRYGPGRVPDDWRQAGCGATASRYRAVFAPMSFALALDEVLEEADVTLWYDTLVCGAIRKGGRLTALEVESKSGRGLFQAAVFIDATGDADLACLAGAECAESTNHLSIWGTEASLTAAREAVALNNGEPLLQTFRLGGDNAGRQAPDHLPPLRGTNAVEVTRFVLEGRKLLRAHYQREQAAAGVDGRSAIFPVTLPSMAQFRTTRRIAGRATLQTGQERKGAEDSIGLAPDWRKAGPVWEIPYGTLVPRNVRGLLAAGRCISSEQDAWEVTRVIPVAALTGQAAGAAATLAVRGGTTPDRLDPEAVQSVMRLRGIPCRRDDLDKKESL
jgi:hypothetical protein